MLSVEGLNQFYGGSHILWDVSMTVPQGSCTVLMGRNGMGKSTLLRCLMGLTPVASGSMKLDDTALTALPATARARLGIGYVPQGREIFSQLTVEENLRTGLAARRDGARAIPAVLQALEANGVAVATVTVSRPSLDDVYLNLTGRSFTEAETDEAQKRKEREEAARR